MQKYIDILNQFKGLSEISETVQEDWGAVTYNGKWSDKFVNAVADLETCMRLHNFLGTVTITIDDSEFKFNEIGSFVASGSMDKWKIHINKARIVDCDNVSGWQVNLFLKSDNLGSWITNADLLDKDNPFSKTLKTKIIIDDLDTYFGSQTIQFIPLNLFSKNLQFTPPIPLPDNDTIHANLYFLSKQVINIKLENLYLKDGLYGSALSQTVLTAFSKVFAVATCTEFHSSENVIVDGVKRIEMSVGNEAVDFDTYSQLVKLVSWLYGEKINIRKKLFADRLTLDIIPDATLLGSLEKNLPKAFDQAKERYNFVVLERKDAYVKELKELLKDLRTQSDLYATKIRSLLTNMLRDLLAGLVLVGFTLFTKFSDSLTLDKARLLEYVFYGLAIYYLLSVIIQNIVDWIDMSVTGRELKYWKNVSRELIPDAEFENHRLYSLRGRRRSFRSLYVLISIFYLVIAFACYKYPDILHAILKK